MERHAEDEVETKWRSSIVITVTIEQIQAINLMPLILTLSIHQIILKKVVLSNL